MNWKRFIIFLALMLLVGVYIGTTAVFAAPDEAPLLAPVGTAFTYQGYIEDGGSPANGSYNLRFSLWDDPTSGTSFGTQTKNSVPITNGLFTVTLDFGGVFDGTALWLEIEVQGPGDPGYTPLAPRQAINATPFALYALNIPAHDHFGQTWSGPGTGLTLSGGHTGLDASGTSIGVVGQSASTSGMGLYGEATAVTGITSGVYGKNFSTGGTGVVGEASAPDGFTSGVTGHSASTSGTGVNGRASATSGFAYGVWGKSESTSGKGVYGTAIATSGWTYGVHGQSASTDGTGVFGEALATSGAAYGVYGETASVAGAGVYGVNNGTTGPLAVGVYGVSNADDGRGVFGIGRVGVMGFSFDTPGAGVTGANYSATGATTGVAGYSDSVSGTGVRGEAQATSGTIYGVQGSTNSTAGYDFYAGGVGMDYGTFTGSHEVKLDESVPTEVQPGMIVSATGEAQISYAVNGGVDLSSTLPTVRLAATVEDKAVFGVLVSEVTLPEDHWYATGEGERFAGVNALGEGRVWVSNIHGDIEAGDYITTSTLPGYGQRQGDDILHNYTLGKAIETVDWDSVTETVEYNGETHKVYLLAVVYTSG